MRKLKTDELRAVFGAYDGNLKVIETLCGVTVRVTGDDVRITGDGAKLAELLIDKLADAADRG